MILTTTSIETSRLKELEAKERAHDDYLSAIQEARTRARALPDPRDLPPEARPYYTGYARGYLEALGDIGRATRDAAAARMGPL